MSLQVELLENSFAQIKPHLREFGASFYGNLFTAHPTVRPLFAHTDMVKQQAMLTRSLALIVENLRNPEVLSETLKALGARHVDYGTLPGHYPPVGHVLLKTLEDYLGEDWTSELEQAWSGAYQAVTQLMLEGANYAEHSSSPASTPE